MLTFQDPTDSEPKWVFVETARPYLTEPGARTITPEQIEGAVWGAIIHEARGIAYFQHNNNDACAKVLDFRLRAGAARKPHGQSTQDPVARAGHQHAVLPLGLQQRDPDDAQGHGGSAYIFAASVWARLDRDEDVHLPPG